MLKDKHKLSDFFTDKLIREGDFQSLENADTNYPSSIAYCDTLSHLKKANLNDNVSCIITTLELKQYASADKGLALDTNPRSAFYDLYIQLQKKQNFLHVEKHSLGANTTIHPSAHISEWSQIGSNCNITENVVIKENVTIGNNVNIGPNTVIGAGGILYYKKNEVNKIIPHAGGVIIGDNVTILNSGTVVSSISSNNYTKIDNGSIIGIGTTIGHEAQVSKNCVISGNCVIARGAKIRDRVYIGTGSVVREYITMGKDSKAYAGSIIVKDVAAEETISGNFAYSHSKHLRSYTNLRNS